MKYTPSESTGRPVSHRHNRSRLLILPAFIVLFVVSVFPIGYSFYVSLTDYSLSSTGVPVFIAFDNYMEAFTDPEFLNAVTNTLEISIPALFIEVLIGFSLALVLNRKFKGRGLVLALIVTPFMIAPGAVALAWRLLFDPRYGPINHLLTQLTGHAVNIDWLGSTDIAIRSLTIIDIWQTTPFIMLILLAGLSSISPEVYEAARIDGANSLKAFRYITLPLVKPVLAIAVLFRSIDLLKMFDMCQALTKGGPAGTTMTLSYFTYREGLQYSRVGYGAALSFIVLIAVAVLSMLYIRNTIKNTENPKDKTKRGNGK